MEYEKHERSNFAPLVKLLCTSDCLNSYFCDLLFMKGNLPLLFISAVTNIIMTNVKNIGQSESNFFRYVTYTISLNFQVDNRIKNWTALSINNFFLLFSWEITKIERSRHSPMLNTMNTKGNRSFII